MMKPTRAIIPLIAVLLLAAFVQPAPAQAQTTPLIYKGERYLEFINTNTSTEGMWVGTMTWGGTFWARTPNIIQFTPHDRIAGYLVNLEILGDPGTHTAGIANFGGSLVPPSRAPMPTNGRCYLYSQYLGTISPSQAQSFCENEGIEPDSIFYVAEPDMNTASVPAGGLVEIILVYNYTVNEPSVPIRVTLIPLFLTPPPPPALGRPFKAADELYLTNFEVPDPQNPPHRQMLPTYKSNTVYGIAKDGSNRPAVHAIEDGYVTSVQPLTSEDCFVYNQDNSTCIMDWQNPDTGQLEYFTISASEMSGSSIVYVQSWNSYSEAKITQYVVYDAVGTLDGTQPIAQGCVLGQGIRASGGSGGLNRVHVTFVRATLENINGAGIDLSDQLIDYPEGDNPCDSGRSTCLNTDRAFENTSRWAISGDVTFAVDYPGSGTAGVTMAPGSSISQIIDLSSRTDLSLNEPMLITVSAVGRGGFTVQWGDNTEVVESSTYLGGYYVQIAPTTELAQLKITQNANNPGNVEITRLCVSDDGFPEDFGFVSTSCYFTNPNFVDGLNGWSFSNPAGVQNRFLELGHGGSVGQEVTLYPNDDGSPHEYTFSVTTSGYKGLTTSLSDIRSNLELSWGTISACPIYNPDNPDTENCNILAHQSYIPDEDLTIFEYRFEVSESTRANLFVEAWLVDTSLAPLPESTRLRISQLCIRPEGLYFPGYDRVVSSANRRLDSNGVSCNIATRAPDDDSVWRWISELRRFLQRYFDCTLTARLEELTQQTFDAVALVKAGFQYVGLLGNSFSAWLDSFDNWFLSVLNNFLTTFGGGIWWTLESLFVEVVRLLGFVWQLIAYIFQQIADINQRFGSIANAWQQAEPITIPGFDCSNGEDTIFCRSIWALDNTLFVPNTQGWIILKIIQGTISLHMLIYLVGTGLRRLKGGRNAITNT